MDVFLSPVESGKLIAENASRIKINDNELKKVARIIIDAVKDNSISKVEFAAQVLHPKNGGKEAVNWVFFMDTINFSFWPDEGAKYDVSYKGNIYTGYFAACAAVNKMLDSGVDVTSAEWMASANEEDINKVFLSDSGHSIPLLEERVKAINESGRILLQKWDGSFFNCVLAAKKSAQELLNLIIKDFSSFRDFAYFQGKKVSFLKRAQILVADVLGSLKGTHSAGDFFDIDSLTMFADYRVPQVLAYLGVLEYSQELLDILRERKLLDNGSAEEVELRGASIWACERIVFAIDELRATEGNEIRKVNAAEVDVFLWVYRRQNAKEIDSKVPFHRTRCIYY